MIQKSIKCSLFLLCLLLAVSVSAQKNSAELKKKAAQLEKEIAIKAKLLGEAKKASESSMNQVKLLKSKISKRVELINVISSEIDALDNQIEETVSLIESMENDIEVLKEEYAEMIRQAYKSRKPSDRLMFIFASESINQAFKRVQYLKQYSEYRQKQAAAIIRTQKILEEKKIDLVAQREEKQEKLAEESKQKKTLNSEISQENKLLARLEGQQEKYKKEIQRDKKRQASLKKAIERAIAEEIQKAKGGDKGSSKKLTPEAQKLSDSFAQNKGKLPWPVDNGAITEYFGEHPHPVLKGIKIRNNGVVISSTQGTKARCVFNGTVTKVIIMPGAGKTVLVNHGEYFTIYANLRDVFVSTGDKVTTKQELGPIITSKGVTEIDFQLWKNTTPQNPVRWIYKAE